MIGTRALPASDEEREELVALREQWAQENSLFVETIYSSFWQAGRWPTLRNLQRSLDAAGVDDLDLEGVAREMPDGVGFFNIQEGSASLTVRALTGGRSSTTSSSNASWASSAWRSPDIETLRPRAGSPAPTWMNSSVASWTFGDG